MSAKSIKQQTAEAVAMAGARDAAASTPEQVRAAFLEKRHRLPGVDLESWNIGLMWILEDLEHPLVRTTKEGEAVRVTARDAARALFAFSDSEGAFEALSQGVQVYDQEAFKLVRSLPAAVVMEANQLIPQIITEGLATIPGAGASNPPGTGS